MGAALTSVQSCSRAAPDDNNNDETVLDNNNVVVITAPHPVTTVAPPPVETSTPKIERERDLGDTDQPESLESGPVSDRTYGSDSGLENSGDEHELSRYVVDEDYVDTVVDDSDEDEAHCDDDQETQESLEFGDLGVDRATTFRVRKPEDDHLEKKLDDLDTVTDSLSSRLTQLDISSSRDVDRR